MNTTATKSAPTRSLWRMLLPTAIAVAIIGVALFPALFRGGGSLPFHPHAPAWGLWRGLAPQVQIHIAAAVIATMIGFVVISLPKGSGLHKTLGWAWVLSMAATAGTSFLIRELNPGSFSFIHIISGWTMVALPLGIYAIRRRRNVLSHRRTMLGLFYGGSLVAGALTFIPGRFMYHLFFG